MAVRLTASSIASLPPGEYRDEISPLTLRVLASGRRVFAVRHMATVDGRRYQRRQTIGAFPGISLSDARRLAMQVRTDADSGDPNPSVETTFADLVKAYMRRHSALRNRPKTIEEKRKKLGKDLLPLWGQRPAKSITRRDVAQLMDRILDRATKPGANVAMANRTRALVSSIFSFAVARGLVDANPVVGTQPAGNETARRRYLTDDEIRALWQVWDECDTIASRALRLILLTAQRPGEVLGMRWSELDEDLWAIPADRHKSGRRHFVPLSTAALELIQRQRRLSRVFVFPGRTGDPLADVRSSVRRHTRDAGTAAWSPHVLRKTASDRLARLRVPPHVRTSILGHRLGSVTDVHYTAYDYLEERREALDLWADELHRIVSETRRRM